MSSDTTEPTGSPGNRGRRWPGPTIELEATEIRSGGAGLWFRFGAPFVSWIAMQKDRLTTWLSLRLPPDPPWRAIGAVAAGVFLILVVVVLAGRFGGDDSRIRTVEARIARAEQQMRELAGRAPADGVDPRVIEELTGRMAKLEAGASGARPAGADPALANRMATLEGALKAIEERIGVVARRTDDIDLIARDARERANATAAAVAELTQKMTQLSPSEFEASTNRIVMLERMVASMQADLARRGVGETGDRPVRLAVTAAALNAAVERSDAFTVELSAAKQLAPDATTTLAPLEPYAASGLPSAAALSRELMGLLGTLAQASGTTPREGGFLERLQANAERLVRIRPLDEPPGDDPAAVLTRIEQRAAQADISGALAELAKLPAPARATVQAWITKAQARLAALAASRRFATDAYAALGKMPEAR